MNKERRLYIILGSIVVLAIFIVCIRFVFIHNVINEEVYYTSALWIQENKHEYEIFVDTSTKYTYYREDDTETIISTYPRQVKARLKTPELTGIVAKDVLGSYLTKDLTYNISFDESLQYVVYLLDEGYELQRTVATPQYIEYFVNKGEVTKRLILLQETLIVGDLIAGVEMPSISSYLTKYYQVIEGEK